MTNTRSRIYKFEQQDAKIFAIFFIAFPILMTLNDIDLNFEEFDIERLVIWAMITVDTMILVFFTVFHWLKNPGGKWYYLLLFLKYVGLLTLLIFIQTSLYWLIFDRTKIDYQDVWDDTFGIFIVSTIAYGFLLGIIMLKKAHDAQVNMLKNESTLRANELRILKSQIDPHFLFNNLNTLDSLLDTEPEKAKPYIQKLAMLYQYLLATKDEHVVFLDQELEFANHYIYLIQERFDQHYQFELLDQRSRKSDQWLPTGAIQTVFENIVKHNGGSRKNPIKTTIRIEDEYLEISNNIQSKKKPSTSFKIGLSNLQSRYELLSNQSFELRVDDQFTIRLPYIEHIKQ